MNATLPHQTRTRQHTFPTSRNLLNLDCSADLRSYRRDLGPGVQAKCFEKTSDTIRAQLDEHRAYLLRHRQNGQASGLPSPVPRLDVLQPHNAPSSNTVSPHMSSSSSNYHTASQPRPMRMLSQPHAPQQIPQVPRRGGPVPGRIETYPAGLRQALERCNQYGHQRRPGMVWEVITDVRGNHAGAGKEVVGTYESLQEANTQVADVFLFDGYYGTDCDPTYEVQSDGSLMTATEITVGGFAEIYVRSAPAVRSLGPKRR